MKLVVTNNLGETVTIQIQPNETFIDLKKKVEFEAGISLDLSDITARSSSGNLAIDNEKVIDYFVSSTSFLEEKISSNSFLEEKISSNSFLEEKIYCSVPGCLNQKGVNKDKFFFEFPEEEIRCHQWVLYCRRQLSNNFKLSLGSDSTICSDHFRSDQFVKNTTTLLKRTAVPCINPELPPMDSAKIPKIKLHKCEEDLDELLCRLCGKGCHDCVYIYSKEGRHLQLPEKINTYLTINVEMKDHLPKQVCRSCIEHLNDLTYLSKESIRSENKLSDMNHDTNIVLTNGNVTLKPVNLECPLCLEGIISSPKRESKTEEIVSTSTIKKEFDHMNGNKNIYNCKLCIFQMDDIQSAVDHSHTHFKNNLYPCILCEAYFDSCDTTIEHLLSHDSNNVCKMPLNPETFECQVCLKTFKSQSGLDFHMHFHKDAKKKASCDICTDVFTDDIALMKHKSSKHVHKYKCNKCTKVFSNLTSLQSHEKSHQDNLKPYNCEWCGKSFVRKSMLKNHVTATHRVVYEMPSFACKICYEAFSQTSLAVAHMKNSHKESNECSFTTHNVTKFFICEYCEKSFTSATTLNTHRQNQHNDFKYTCKYCRSEFLTYDDMKNHRISHPNIEIPKEYQTGSNIPLNYLCEYCNRFFLNHVKYTEHLTTHFGSEPYSCVICQKKFKNLKTLSEHRLQEHKSNEPVEEFDFNRPYECHYCIKRFAIEDALVKHIRMHTGEKPFICDICGKGFSQSSGLNTHKKVHSDARPYACHICPRTFKIKGDRDVHIRKHSGERPYKCEYCGKAFMTQHVYSQHRKIHTGERPYKCDVCGICFRRSHVLTVHKRIHTGEKPNVCDICGKRYRQKGDMLKHRRAQHSNNV